MARALAIGCWWCFLALGCNDARRPGGASLDGGGRAGLTAVLNRTTYHSGEPVWVTATLTNLTSTAVGFVYKGSVPANEVVVRRRGKASAVPFTQLGRMQRGRLFHDMIATAALESGNSYTFTYRVDQIYDIRAPGEYEVVVSRGVGVAGRRDPVVVSSEPIAFTVGKRERY